MRKFIATIMVTLAASTAAAQACDEQDAMARFEKAAEAGVILNAGMYDDQVTLTVDAPTWELLDLNTRLGMLETFECAVFGEGQVLVEAQVIDGRGIRLATWDGIKRSIDAIR